MTRILSIKLFINAVLDAKFLSEAKCFLSLKRLNTIRRKPKSPFPGLSERTRLKVASRVGSFRQPSSSDRSEGRVPRVKTVQAISLESTNRITKVRRSRVCLPMLIINLRIKPRLICGWVRPFFDDSGRVPSSLALCVSLLRGSISESRTDIWGITRTPFRIIHESAVSMEPLGPLKGRESNYVIS